MSAAATVPVWSPVVRLTHAAVAALVLFNLFNDTGRVHRLAGYAAAALVLLRLVHGWTRRRDDPAALTWPARRELVGHVRELLRGQVQRPLGHNPLGLCVAWLMWALVLALGVTGWMSRLDAFWGDDWLLELHEGLGTGLQVAVLVHWAGVVVMSLLQRENLVAAMVTGRKRAPAPGAASPAGTTG